MKVFENIVGKGENAGNQQFFSFSHNVLFLICNRNHLSKINPFPNNPWFLHVYSISLLKTPWEKEKLLVTSNFTFSQCFLPFWRTMCYFCHVWNCHMQTLSVWKSKICRLGRGLYLLSAKFIVFNLVKSNILSFGTELTLTALLIN